MGRPLAAPDVVLDTVPTPVEIDRALARLEMKVLPRHCRLGKKWKRSGIFLAPITLVAIKAKSS
jgi:hypothetical protein